MHLERFFWTRLLPIPFALAVGCDVDPNQIDSDTDTDTDTGDAETGMPDDSTTEQAGDCAELTQADVDSGAVESGCYDVPTALNIMSPLSIAADTQLRFSEFAGLYVTGSGSLTISGTEPDSVVFEPLGATWLGLSFSGSASPENRIEGTTVTGVAADAAISIGGGSRVQVAQSRIVENTGIGILVDDASSFTLAQSEISGVEIPLTVALGQVEAIASDNVLLGNEEDAVRVRAGTLSNDATWQDPGVPLRLDGSAFIDDALTLTAGVVIEMPLGAEFSVSTTGSLAATGTAESPVRLRGQQDQPGYWQGLGVFSRASANRLEHTVVENGGSDAWTGASETVAGVYLGEDSKLIVQNSTLRASGGAGFMAENADNDISGFANNVFDSNAYPLALTPDAAKALDGSNTFSNNDDDLVFVWPWSFSEEGMLSSGSWANPGIPYRVASYLEVIGDWEVEAGTEIQVAQDVEIHIAPNASIRTLGTPNDVVRFVGADALPGYWQGLGVHSVSSSNVLENVEIRHAGSSNFDGSDDSDAAIFMGGLDGTGRVEFRSAVLADTNGFGISIAEGTVVGCGSVTFSGNTKGDVNPEGIAQTDC